MATELIRWLLFAAYVLGWMLSIPGALRRIMLKWVCTHCDTHCCGHGPHSVRGAYRDRSGGDIGVAVFVAAFWLPRLLVMLVGAAFRLGGRGVTAAVNRATPLTEPELARRIDEQEREIARLSRQINQEATGA